MRKILIGSNLSKEEAYSKFDDVRNGIEDFKKESVSISGNLRNANDGWSVTKIVY